MGTHPIFESDFDCLTDCCHPVMQDPNEDTEWNDALRKHGILPARPKTPEMISMISIGYLKKIWTMKKKNFLSKYGKNEWPNFETKCPKINSAKFMKLPAKHGHKK